MNNKKEKWISDHWYVSPWNFEDEVTKNFQPPKEVKIYDVTMRDGEQQPGIVFTKDDKIRIAEALSEAGVHRIEAGMPAVSPDDRAAVEEMVKRNMDAQIFAFCRAMPGDIELAADCGVDGVVIESPVNQSFIKYGYGWEPEKAIERAVIATQSAKERGLYTTFFTIDGSRADIDWYFYFIDKVANEGYFDSLVVVDTFSGLSPNGMDYFVRQIKKKTDKPLEIHCHNMFSMAVANSVAAVLSGAEVIHTTVNGIGEQAGNCPMETTIMSLLVLYGIDVGIKYNSLFGLSKLIEKIAGKGPNQALVGDMTYDTEIGIGASTFRKLKMNSSPYRAMQYPIVPEFVGNRPQSIVLGKKSGIDNIEIWAEKIGCKINQEEAREIVGRVKDKGIEIKRLLSEEEFREIVQQVHKG